MWIVTPLLDLHHLQVTPDQTWTHSTPRYTSLRFKSWSVNLQTSSSKRWVQFQPGAMSWICQQYHTPHTPNTHEHVKRWVHNQSVRRILRVQRLSHLLKLPMVWGTVVIIGLSVCVCSQQTLNVTSINPKTPEHYITWICFRNQQQIILRRGFTQFGKITNQLISNTPNDWSDIGPTLLSNFVLRYMLEHIAIDILLPAGAPRHGDMVRWYPSMGLFISSSWPPHN